MDLRHLILICLVLVALSGCIGPESDDISHSPKHTQFPGYKRLLSAETSGNLLCHQAGGSGVASNDIVMVRENTEGQLVPFVVCNRFNDDRVNVSFSEWRPMGYGDSANVSLSFSPSHFITEPIPRGACRIYWLIFATGRAQEPAIVKVPYSLKPSDGRHGYAGSFFAVAILQENQSTPFIPTDSCAGRLVSVPPIDTHLKAIRRSQMPTPTLRTDVATEMNNAKHFGR